MPGDPLEQRRAVGPPRRTPAKEQDSAQIVAVRLDPCVRARKAAHDPLTACRKRTKTGRPFDRVGQDQMDMAPAFSHAAMLRSKGSDGQRERVEGGRSEEHTSELQSLMRNSSTVLSMKKKNT